MRAVTTEEQFAIMQQKVRGGVSSRPDGRKPQRATDLLDGRPGRAEATRSAPAPYRSKTETAYANYLQARVWAHEIQEFRYEPLRLQLADRTTLTPDFLLVMPDGSLQLHEVKYGKWTWEDGLVKLKIAARLYPWWRFVLVKRIEGQWELKELPT